MVFLCRCIWYEVQTMSEIILSLLCCPLNCKEQQCLHLLRWKVPKYVSSVSVSAMTCRIQKDAVKPTGKIGTTQLERRTVNNAGSAPECTKQSQSQLLAAFFTRKLSYFRNKNKSCAVSVAILLPPATLYSPPGKTRGFKRSKAQPPYL